MTQSHGMMRRDADGQMDPCAFANPDNVLRGTPDEKAFIYLTSADGNTMLGVWDCGAYAERLIGSLKWFAGSWFILTVRNRLAHT